jgi:hypothetical protein
MCTRCGERIDRDPTRCSCDRPHLHTVEVRDREVPTPTARRIAIAMLARAHAEKPS